MISKERKEGVLEGGKIGLLTGIAFSLVLGPIIGAGVFTTEKGLLWAPVGIVFGTLAALIDISSLGALTGALVGLILGKGLHTAKGILTGALMAAILGLFFGADDSMVHMLSLSAILGIIGGAVGGMIGRRYGRIKRWTGSS
jgi:hypothetical protein